MLYDCSELAIPTDEVDEELLAPPPTSRSPNSATSYFYRRSSV
jgi:hypothetical protein